MAFVEKAGQGYVVKQGNTGEVLSRFRGKEAKKRADKEVSRLHKKNMPSSRNRGKAARNRFGKNGSRKK